MIPTITAFIAAHQLTDVTVVADAGMLPESNRRAIADAGLSYVLGARIPDIPWVIADWRKKHPGKDIPDGHVFTQPWPATANGTSRDEVIYYQYRADRARRSMRGIDEQVGKAEKAVAGKVPVKRNRFVTLSGGERTVNRRLETKARALAGIKGSVTNMSNPNPDLVIGAYHQLWHVEKSFRMSKHDLRARPIYHHLRESIDAHLNVVFAALAVTRHVEAQTGWSIRRSVQTARRYRTVEIRAGQHLLTAEDPLPTDLRDALAMII